MYRLSHKFSETGPPVNNTTRWFQCRFVLWIWQMRSVLCECCIAPHEALFTEELMKPSVFGNAALLPSKLFTLFILIYFKATMSLCTLEGRYLLASLIQHKMVALNGFLCLKIPEKWTEKWPYTISVMNLLFVRLLNSIALHFYVCITYINLCF